MRQQEVAIATRQGEFTALENSRRLLHQKIDTIQYEVQSLAAQEQEGLQKRTVLTDRAAELENRERIQQEQVATGTADLENLRHNRDTANTELTESKVALAAEEQLCASYRHQKQNLEQRIRELAQVVEQRRARMFLVHQPQGTGSGVEIRNHVRRSTVCSTIASR